MLFPPMKSRSFERAIKAFTDLQISTHQLPFQRDPIGDSVNFEVKFPVSHSVVVCLQPGMDEENLECFRPEFVLSFSFLFSRALQALYDIFRLMAREGVEGVES